MPLEPAKSILSIQSHVVHGYVGNKAATFPLQCQGWDVDVLNTVNFSNHTGYGSVRGTKASSDDIQAIYDGLKTINCKYDALLTGYIPGDQALEAIGEIGRDLKQSNPDSIWLLDPVMGDEGQLYVSETVIPAYKKILIKGGVDVITPNQFEAELLVGYKIESKDTLRKALKELHNKYDVKNVAITSFKLEEGSNILAVASSKHKGIITSSLFEIPLIESYFTGVGDLFSSLLIDRIFRYTRDIKDQYYLETAVNQVLTIMAQVLKTTTEAAEKALGQAPKSKMGAASIMKECELKLIECRDIYEHTEQKFKAFAL
ncbi:Pyridoxamine kinase [Wickerhamomyces ciferrii]|uniref:pyridoxal kinase n=1 Tax=Wickerhamomyces ciferrii (strain ATCC 14091 / BCRC 22168 / CBS 111 / JCM 3599 / NBRC 0793 / NRRL Y-1031 F-60-10) TaxID=1206466 RepID=K0KGN6_WICCF|nr:Pyridoxamine kinase [Wickerhamomyces ciferrii]CCH44315.1 Pyridoxamine kinase [Wickerhamomyces ciferrii]